MDRLTLHAERVVLPPVGDRAEPLEITSPLPRDYERLLKQLRKVRLRGGAETSRNTG